MKFDYDNYISPCQDKCLRDHENKYCISCKRTVEEIKNWKNMTRDEKLNVMANLKTR